VQIEDGGDSPEVNQLLLDALRAGTRHQVGEGRARRVLRAIDDFERAEAERWEQVKAGTLPPIELKPADRLDELMQDGYDLMEANQCTAGCDKWLEAWELVKHMATPEMRTTQDFDQSYPAMLQSVFNWSSDLEMELGNAGLDDATYHEHRIRYVHEFLAQFPDEDELTYVNHRRAEGEALWHLGRQAEAESVYSALVEKLPDQAWAYIGWSDQYYLGSRSPGDYEAAEAILLRALAQPGLEDREHALDRLVRLYEEWGKPEKGDPFAAELAEIEQHPEPQRRAAGIDLAWPLPPELHRRARPTKLKRNDPCWCGSGKKYKRCHMRSDKEG
jgi:hypothetical protein